MKTIGYVSDEMYVAMPDVLAEFEAVVVPVELELLLPGMVAALTYASVPTPAAAARAMPAVRRFINR